jgi:hypothetical protein
MKPAVTFGVGVPRGAYVRFPLGNAFGEAGKPDLQRDILLEALTMIYECTEPGQIVDMPFRWRRGRTTIGCS